MLSVEPRFRSHAYLDILSGKGMDKAFVTIGCEYLGECEWPLDIWLPSENKMGFFGSSKSEVIKTVVHEFGHSFGGLADEYNGSSQSFLPTLGIPNCDNSSKNKWTDIIDSYIPGCMHANWYRAYFNTLMKYQYAFGVKFEAINERELLKDISEESSEIASISKGDNYQLNYLVELNYDNGNITENDFALISGEISTKQIGEDYYAVIRSFDNKTLFTKNFSFSLVSSFSPSEDWFDEDGNQIYTPRAIEVVSNKTTELFSFPYFNNAKTIRIFNSSGSFQIEIDVSGYHDLDKDFLISPIDNCPLIYNPDQSDQDNDTVGDSCETDWCSGVDITKDGLVGQADLDRILQNWACRGVCNGADVNADGFVGQADLDKVLQNWARTDCRA